MHEEAGPSGALHFTNAVLVGACSLAPHMLMGWAILYERGKLISCECECSSVIGRNRSHHCRLVALRAHGYSEASVCLWYKESRQRAQVPRQTMGAGGRCEHYVCVDAGIIAVHCSGFTVRACARQTGKRAQRSTSGFQSLAKNLACRRSSHLCDRCETNTISSRRSRVNGHRFRCSLFTVQSSLFVF